MPLNGKQIEKQANLSAHVDWLNFRIDDVTFSDLAEFLDIPESFFLGQLDNLIGYKIYDQSFIFSDLKVYTGSFVDEEEKEHTSIYAWFSGHACAYLEQVEFLRLGIKTWSEFLTRLKVKFGQKLDFRRIDLNIDDQVSQGQAYFKPFDLLKFVESDRFSYGNSTSYSVQGTDKSGMTLYLGAKTSSKQIRIYDKKAERLAKLEQDGELLEAWTRTEIQFLRESANAVIEKYINSGISLLDLIKGYLKSNVHFYSSDNWKNEENPKEFRPWTRFLGKSAPFNIHVERRNTPLNQKFEWLDNGGGLAITKAYKLLDDNNLLPKDLSSRMKQGLDDTIKYKGYPIDLSKKLVAYLIENNRFDLIDDVISNTYDPFKNEKKRLKQLAEDKRIEKTSKYLEEI
ncbi:replication initiation factor domain-containing protein [Lactococcus formosensis]|uniref:replication initiation factor domain-containing protein n=1 Tax=Lactococcus formosensis TaxID=1281486 RepID=UPI00254EF57E|nr:replication initiation factor domain-containing protein [Lactococcus formosensis]